MRQDSVFTTCPCLPHVLRRAPRRYGLRKRPLRPQLCLCLAAKSALPPPRSALHEAVAGQTSACAQARPAPYNNTPGAQLPRFTLKLKRPSAAGSSASRPGRRLSCRPFAPPPRKAAAPGRSGQVRGASRPRLTPAPARPRAPLTAVGGKARANDRGLARK